MSVHTLCDSCDRIIDNPSTDAVQLDVVIRNRYSKDKENFTLHLCKGCDMRVAKALRSLLPSMAYPIEPNLNVENKEAK